MEESIILSSEVNPTILMPRGYNENSYLVLGIRKTVTEEGHLYPKNKKL